MPGRIDTSRENGVIAHVDLADLAIVGDDGSPMELTGVELHAAGIIHLIVVAVDTLAGSLLTTEHIVDHHPLVVILQATLVQGQFLIGHITGRDESVADIRVDAIR